MKKRWIVLSVIGAVAVLAMVLFRDSCRPVTVSAVTLEPCRVEQTVSCMGVVEVSDAMVVALPMSCVIRQVNVKSGDRVREGDVLAVVDKEATRQMLFDNAALVALAALPEEITATCDATVVEVGAVANQSLEYGTPCAVLAADENMQVRIAIRERDLRIVKQGMSVRITGDGFEKAYYDGKLTEISSTARTDDGGTVVEGLVVLSAGAFDSSLRLGLTAKAAIVTSVTENGYVVPYEAVLSDEAGSFVYVFSDGQAQRQSISVAAQVEDGVLLEDAALAQMQIICDAESIADSGQKVTIRGSDA